MKVSWIVSYSPASSRGSTVPLPAPEVVPADSGHGEFGLRGHLPPHGQYKGVAAAAPPLVAVPLVGQGLRQRLHGFGDLQV